MSSLATFLHYERCLLYTLAAGILVSIYALYVEIRFEMEGSDYEAACDLSALISCTRALSSPFARGFGVVAPLLGEDSLLNQKNALYGLLGYAALVPVVRTRKPGALLAATFGVGVILNLMSVYLFIVLLQIETICLVCYSTYVINAAFLYYAYKRWQIQKKSEHFFTDKSSSTPRRRAKKTD